VLIDDCENKNEIWERMRKSKRKMFHKERRDGGENCKREKEKIV